MVQSARGWMSVLTLSVTCVVLLAGPVSGDTEERVSPDSKALLLAARQVVAASGFCALVTIGDDGSPHVRMMDAFEPEEDMVVWMGTNTLSRKVDEIRSNPRVAVYYADPKAPGYVTIKGVARLVDDPSETAKRWKDGWSAFYREDRSNYILIEIRPETIEVVNYPAGIVSGAETWEAPSIDLGESPTAQQD